MDELMFVDGLVSERDLVHYGVPRRSGRYPWGSGENPYHHGASSPFGRLRERREAKKKAQARAAAVEKARQAKAAKAEYEKNKAEALKSGSAQRIAPYLKDLSSDEIRELKNRLQLEAEFRQLAVRERSEMDPKVAARMAKLDQVNKYADTGIATYNNVARVLNAFSGTELPIIGTKTKKEIRRQDASNAEDLMKKAAERQKAEASARKENAEADAAEYKRDRKKFEDKRNDADRAESRARKEQERQQQQQTKQNQTKQQQQGPAAQEKKRAADIVEEFKDIEVDVRDVETSPDRLLELQEYLLEDKRKKK